MSYPPPPPPPYPYQGPGGPGDWPGDGHHDQRQATTALVLGILSLAICALLGPVALIIGRNSLKEIDASHGRLGGHGKAQAGFICGLIATILMALAIVIIVVALATNSA